MRRHVVLILTTLFLLTGCSDDGTPSTPITGDGGGGKALTWGNGDYGVVLAHGAAFDAASWTEQAEAIAEQGATVVAVEDISTEGIAAAVTSLQDDGIEKVALVGGSAGADAILRLSAEEPDLADQLVLLSPNTVVEGLGDQPKLFIASEGEPGSDLPNQLAEVSPGDDNQVLVVGGSAHAQNIFDTAQGPDVLAAMLERLDR
ncbi:hypothetical protein [Nocardioides sp.]|uniref:alpha/beta fold hydrolase n=1 Tax=Nocardioides sp. TaxID=35761 RepID=UPI002B264A3A|nr:hypothetical protein [Nocardioides sp.]